MKRGDERENRIHLESSRNGFIAYSLVTISFWAYKITQAGETSWDLYAVAYGPFFLFVLSVVYYHQKGLKNSLSLSSLRSD
jgi:hypothetical protein